MGNQLTGIAPSQILPVEHYLTDVADCHFELSLGSTRFFKVAKARSKEGPIVVKVFVIHDPSLPLTVHRQMLEEICHRLQGIANCLPYQKALISEKSALLLRQYAKYSLYDRLSTRPFLTSLEKRWVAFQLLCALSQCHQLGVCHGDIKSENIVMTTWNWLLLADFASFKPTFLPQDNPADFSYFFDTSRRRTCYIAPERFIESNRVTEMSSQNIDLTGTDMRRGALLPAMDVFSAGCVIIELFTDGLAPFDLSQLLAYRAADDKHYQQVISKIKNRDIQEMVVAMTQRDPTMRPSADEVLRSQKDRAFPAYFYTFLRQYVQRFASVPCVSSDDRINRVKRDFSLIVQKVCTTGPSGSSSSSQQQTASDDSQHNTGLLPIISLVTSSLVDLRFCETKLSGVELLLSLAKLVSPDIVLDRIIPYLLSMVNDSCSPVRCAVVAATAQCLSILTSVPKGDANIFPEYIFPKLSHLTQDPVVQVRVAYAENIALLAETAMRFLEMSQQDVAHDRASGTLVDVSQYKQTYESELQALRDLVQQKVVSILSDAESVVKQTLLASGLTRLCVFFGQQKANDVLLIHMVTFLNEKYDRQLRSSFFDSIVGVAAYIGWQCSAFLQPLLQQGLNDPEEFVVYKSVCALRSLAELGLIQKPVLKELVGSVLPLLSHPNIWIRHGAVGFVCTVAHTLNAADVHCNLLPSVKPYLDHEVMQLDHEVVLMDALSEPVPRPVFDHVVRSPHVERLFEVLEARHLVRNTCRPGHPPVYPETDEQVTPLLRKLTSLGLKADNEDKLLRLKEAVMKIHRTRLGDSSSSSVSFASSTMSASSQSDDKRQDGVIEVGWTSSANRRSENLLRVSDLKAESAGRQKRRLQAALESPSVSMNNDWQQMFGSAESRQSVTVGQKLSRSSTLVPVAESKISSPLVQPVFQPQETLAAVSSGGGASGTLSPVAPPPTSAGDVAKETGTMSGSSREVTPTASELSPQKTLRVDTAHDGAGSMQSSTSTLSISQLSALSDRSQHQTLARQTVQVKQTKAMAEFHSLLHHLADQYSKRRLAELSVHEHARDKKTLPGAWRARGILVAHLNEHKGAVNRIAVCDEQPAWFATCSNDGSVKLFDCVGIEGRSKISKSRLTYKQEGQVKAVTFCQGAQSLAFASDNGTIQVLRVDTAAGAMSCEQSRTLDQANEGLVTDMTYFDSGSQNTVAYSSVHGYLTGWDLRAPTVAWQLHNDSKHGLVTSLAVHSSQLWMVAATSNGVHVCWDLRFRLPITTISHPTGARVRRVLCHPTRQSWIVSALQGNNEVSMWDVETGAHERTLWASIAPPLSQTKATLHAFCGMHMSMRDTEQPLLLTGGTDMRIRCWDLSQPVNTSQCHIVVPAATDIPNQTIVSYKQQLIDGTEVILETYSKSRTPVSDDFPRHGPESPAPGHHDLITDVTLCHSSQPLIVSASRDGVVKVWK